MDFGKLIVGNLMWLVVSSNYFVGDTLLIKEGEIDKNYSIWVHGVMQYEDRPGLFCSGGLKEIQAEVKALANGGYQVDIYCRDHAARTSG